MTLDHLTNQASREQELRQKVEQALRDGRISKSEYDFFMRKEFGVQKEETQKPDRRKQALTKTLAVVLLMAFCLGLLSFMDGSITGKVIIQQVEHAEYNLTITQNTTFLENITGKNVYVAGSIRNGSANITATYNNQTYVIFNGSAKLPPRYVTTEYESYPLNTTVNISIYPQNATATIWIIEPNGSRALSNGSYIPKTIGTYTVDAIINDSGLVELGKVSFTTGNLTSRKPISKKFNTCGEICDMRVEGSVLFSVKSENSTTVEIYNITYEQERENQPPVLTKPLEDLTLVINTTASIPLDEHFSDPENRTLVFDYTEAPGLSIEFVGTSAFVSASQPGVYETRIYASDLEDMAQDGFKITVGQTRTTSQETTNTTQQATNNTSNVTNITQPTTCENPDPNLRPPECFVGQESKFFKEDYNFNIENKNRALVAQFNAIGNLLIKGDIVENSGGQPSRDDFSVGYMNEDDEYIVTAWVATSSGDLHLQGNIHEEQLSLQVPRGTYSFQSRKGINLGYIDPRSGDLYLRGNIIPYRRIG